jgi:hypothetical protein
MKMHGSTIKIIFRNIFYVLELTSFTGALFPSQNPLPSNLEKGSVISQSPCIVVLHK